MIIKILDDQERPVCVYVKGRWAGNSSPVVLSEALQLLIFGIKNRSQRFFSEICEKLPEKESTEVHKAEQGLSSERREP